MFNYPCVADGAGVRRYGGHASFVTAVRFIHNMEGMTFCSYTHIYTYTSTCIYVFIYVYISTYIYILIYAYFVDPDRSDPSPLLMVSTGGEDLSTMLWSIDPLTSGNIALSSKRRVDRYENAL